MISIRVSGRSEPSIVPSMRNNNKWSRWSKDSKSSHKWSAVSTRILRVFVRKESHSQTNHLPGDFGNLYISLREMEQLTSGLPRIGLGSHSLWFQLSSSCTLLSQSFMVQFTLSITTIISGKPSISNSLLTDISCAIRPLQDWHELKFGRFIVRCLAKVIWEIGLFYMVVNRSKCSWISYQPQIFREHI